jgi:hypothetical protein
MATFEYKTLRTTGRMVKGTFVCFIILSVAAACANARRFADGPVKLVLRPAKAPEPPQKYGLLPKADRQIDADAVPLYEKAIQAMPNGRKQEDQIREWLKLPPEQLPVKQVEEFIQRHTESLRLAARAARCKECNWPEWKPGMPGPELTSYRKVAFVVALWVRWEIASGGHEGALLAMQTGFAMADHLSQGPTIVQNLVAVAVGALICREVELFVQGQDSPNLYWALANLPRSLANMEKAIEKEGANLKVYSPLGQDQMQQQVKALDRTRLIANRLDNNLNALQCAEAIRHHAALHNGQLPNELSDISELKVPIDVTSNKAFDYRRTDTGALLQSAMPEGGDAVDTVWYEIVLKK